MLSRRLSSSIAFRSILSPTTQPLFQSFRIKPFSTSTISKGDTITLSQMTWPEFFATRKRLQLIQRFSGIPFVFAFWVAEGFVLSLPIFDPTRTIFEMDPVVIVGLSTIAGSAVSFFSGATITGALWRYFKSNKAMLLDKRQKDFYSRITKYRANVPPNPTQMNFSFDFYGEKVNSVQDYRNWLRRQSKLKASRILGQNE